MTKFSTVTTFNLKTQSFGLEMIKSYYKFWPDDSVLYVFLENRLDKINYE